MNDCETELFKEILLVVTDGGGDHNVSHASVQVALICIFLHLDLDMLVAILNIALQHLFIFYTNHPLQGFRSHCSVRGYSSLLVTTAEAEATTRTGRQHTHAHTHTTPNSTLYYLQT